jgi:hypothetical protein
MPIYCAICNAIWRSETERDAHTRQRNCVENTNPPPQGITSRQQNELGTRVSRRLSKEDQWFSIFDLLFPGEPRPPSPYIDASLFESSLAYHNFLTSQGPGIIQRVLSASNAWQLAGQANSQAFQRQILEDGLDAVFQEWVRRGAGNPENPSAGPATVEGSNAADVGSSEGRSGSGELVSAQIAHSVSMMDDAASTNSALRTGTLSSVADSSEYVQSHSDTWWGNYDDQQNDLPDFGGMEIADEDVSALRRIVSDFSSAGVPPDWQSGAFGGHYMGA